MGSRCSQIPYSRAFIPSLVYRCSLSCVKSVLSRGEGVLSTFFYLFIFSVVFFWPLFLVAGERGLLCLSGETISSECNRRSFLWVRLRCRKGGGCARAVGRGRGRGGGGGMRKGFVFCESFST